MEKIKVNVLGTKYSVIIEDCNAPGLKENQRVGYCFFDAKEIHIADLRTDKDWRDESEKVRQVRTNIIFRHEIIHAFLYESGLCQNSNESGAWAMNEEMVDWLAIQFPKICKAIDAVNALDCHKVS